MVDCRKTMVDEMLQKSKFSLCFIFMLHEVLFLLCISYLYYMFYYVFITYLYVHVYPLILL